MNNESKRYEEIIQMTALILITLVNFNSHTHCDFTKVFLPRWRRFVFRAGFIGWGDVTVAAGGLNY